ncbi:MAG: glycoside hydrolase family 3 protein [Patescibacteria group bacterium]|jgi:beta-glucosidase
MKKIPILKIGLVLLIILASGIGLVALKNKYITPSDNSLSEKCRQKNLPYLNPALPTQDRVNDLMGRMNDWEKIGQMVLIEKNSIHDLSDITRYNLGALLSGGGAGPEQNTPLAWLQMVNSFQAAAKKTCLGIPLLYGTDAIHGNGNVSGATIFPHFIGLGATIDPDLVSRVAKATAEEVAATGIYWNYAPNLDVAKDIRWGKTYETFGSDTANVAKLGVAYLEGTQEHPNGYLNVLANPKHFIGGGAMEYGTARNKNFKLEEGNISLDEKTLRQVHLVPFQEAVAGGARAIMVSTASWKGKTNSSNHHLLTEILKNELGFSGFLVSDWYGVYMVSPSRYESLVVAINAGIDMVMTPFEYKDFMSNMQKAVSNGDIKKERIDDAVKRILTVKFETGLFDRPPAEPAGLSVIGSDENRALAREAVRKSQVLLKNKNFILPLAPSLGKILVGGSAANNLGRQAGGWTVEWQGVDGNNSISGTTILEAIKNTVSKNTEVEYDEKGHFSIGDSSADVGIAVVGEKPYAEGWGDEANPKLSPEDLSAIKKIKAKSKKIVVIIISGRPLDISPYSKEWDAIIASWLPGGEGEGITDVLFGLYPFTGVLPVKWNY